MNMIDAYLEHLRRGNCTDATLEGRREILTRLNRSLPYGLGQTTPDELAGWLYRDDWSVNTRATYYRCITSFYRWATKPSDPWLSFNPTVDMEAVAAPRGLPRPVTDDQLRRVLTEAPEPIRLWALIAAYQGLRCIEISRLDREHITERTLFVVQGKGGRARMHDTDPYVWAAVRDLPPGPVARKQSGERADRRYISIMAAKCFGRQLGMPGVSMHRLRHWLGVHTQAAFKDIRVTQAVLGHVSLQSTQIYTDATVEQQRAARSMLPRLAG